MTTRFYSPFLTEGAPPLREATSAMLANKLLSVVEQLSRAQSSRHLRQAFHQVLPEYVAVKRFIDLMVLKALEPRNSEQRREHFSTLVELAISGNLPLGSLIFLSLIDKTARKRLPEVELSFDDRVKLIADFHKLTAADRKTVKALAKEHIDLGLLFGQVDGNSPQLWSALAEGFWPLQAMDLCLTTLFLLSTGKLLASRPETMHWICLRGQSALSQWQSIVFRNDPILMQRFRSQGPTLTTAEVRSRLGL